MIFVFCLREKQRKKETTNQLFQTCLLACFSTAYINTEQSRLILLNIVRGVRLRPVRQKMNRDRH